MARFLLDPVVLADVLGSPQRRLRPASSRRPGLGATRPLAGLCRRYSPPWAAQPVADRHHFAVGQRPRASSSLLRLHRAALVEGIEEAAASTLAMHLGRFRAPARWC